MKSLKSALFAFAIIVSGALYSQSAEDYAALTEFLPAEKLSSLQSDQGDGYANMAYLNRHGYYLGETEGKDFSMYPLVASIPGLYSDQPLITLDMISNGQLNLAAYDFKLKRDKYMYYRIGESDKVLVILPTNLTFEQRIQE